MIILDFQFIQWSVFSINRFGIMFIFDVSTQQQGKRTYQLLFSGLSHELRTPIATILTQAEVLGLSNVSDPAKAQSLKLLKQETQRMSRLVNQMLILGRLETEATIEHRPLDLSALVQDIIVQIQAETESQHREV